MSSEPLGATARKRSFSGVFPTFLPTTRLSAATKARKLGGSAIPPSSLSAAGSAAARRRAPRVEQSAIRAKMGCGAGFMGP
ncbi:MAG: hypothetical protein CK548_07305 [Opitutia bacterium]|nr:MAG: hypothetical protein CK548_07305 [Opitutae bacterium]